MSHGPGAGPLKGPSTNPPMDENVNLTDGQFNRNIAPKRVTSSEAHIRMAQKHRSDGESLATEFDLTSSVIEPKALDSDARNNYNKRPAKDCSIFLIFIVLVLESDDELPLFRNFSIAHGRRLIPVKNSDEQYKHLHSECNYVIW